MHGINHAAEAASDKKGILQLADYYLAVEKPETANRNSFQGAR